MKYFSILFIVLVISCSSKSFPDSIRNKLDYDHFRIGGTKLYVKEIDDFEYFPDVNIFKKSDSIYIHCLYTEIDFTEKYNTKNFDFYHNRNYQVISYQDFKINGDQGVYYKLTEGNSCWLYFIFGDNHAENRIVATYPIDQ
jgi:hypothetical protein